MKKIVLNTLGILMLMFSLLISKANYHVGMDSIFPQPVDLYPGKVKSPIVFLRTDQVPEKNTNELKKFIFSLTLTPRFETTIPPLNLYFEHGIASVASAGASFGALYDSDSKYNYHSATLSFGVRGCAYAFPIISMVSGKEIKSFGFQPFLGMAYDYRVTSVSLDGTEIGPYHSSDVGIVAGTRWYPGKGKFALLGEFNSTGIGNNLRLGISLGR